MGRLWLRVDDRLIHGQVVAAWLPHLKADRIRSLEADVAELERDRAAEVWFTDYMMTVKLRGTIVETEEDFLDKKVANNLGFMRLYWADGKIWREYWDFIFEGAKDIQSTLQIQLRLKQLVQADRAQQKLPPIKVLTIWGDNAGDFKGGDLWDQWCKGLRDQGGGNDSLVRVVLKYHASGEGKTELDAHFGHLATMRRKLERAGMERRDVLDLLQSMKDIPATHVMHVKLDRDDESRFYTTANNIKGLHEVEVTRQGTRGREDSRAVMRKVDLDIVRERKTKRARQKKAVEQGDVQLKATVQQCQKCLREAEEDEDLDEWMQCEQCERSWHKTCVGYPADKATESIQWAKCANCGGADPKGDALEKRRKKPTCTVCGKLLKGNSHAACKEQRQAAAGAFRTPAATLISVFHPTVRRKEKQRSDEKRKNRKGRKRRGKSGRITRRSLVDLFGEHG